MTKFVLYVINALLTLSFLNASRVVNFFFPKERLIFSKSTIEECVSTVKTYHQELFDPTLLMFVKSLATKKDTEVHKKYLESFFEFQENWSYKFDRKDPDSWEFLIDDSFKRILQNDQKLAVEFIKTVVLPERELMDRIKYEFDVDDFLNYVLKFDYKIISYLRIRTFEKFVDEVIEILSFSISEEESNLRFRKLFIIACDEINMMSNYSFDNFDKLAQVPIKYLKQVALGNKIFEDIHDLVDYLLYETRNLFPVKKKATIRDYDNMYDLKIRDEYENESDYEQNMVLEVGYDHNDYKLSKRRRFYLKPFYKLKYHSIYNFDHLKIPKLEGILKNSLKSEYFTFDFGQERVINFLFKSSSYQAKLLWDLFTLNYYKPHLYGYKLLYGINRPRFNALHGDLTKTFINSIIYSALKRFNKLLPEHADIMNRELGLNPELLEQVNAEDFINHGDDPHHVMIRMAMWDHEETFDLFHKCFGPSDSLKVIDRLFLKALKRGNQQIIDYLLGIYSNRIPEIAGSILKKALAKHNEKLINFIIKFDYNLDPECLEILGKYSIIFDDQNLFKMVLNRFNPDVLIDVLVPYAFRRYKINFTRFLLKSWTGTKSDAILLKANYYASRVFFFGFMDPKFNFITPSSTPKITFKLLAETDDVNIFKSYLDKVDKTNREDAFEALKIAKHRFMVKTIFEIFEFSLDSKTAALIIKNLVKETSNIYAVDDLIEIAKKSHEELSEDDFFLIIEEASKYNSVYIYKINFELKLKISSNFKNRLDTLINEQNECSEYFVRTLKNCCKHQ